MNQPLDFGQVVALSIAGLFWLIAVIFLVLYKFQLKHRDFVLMVISAVIGGVITMFTVAAQATEIGILFSPVGLGVGGIVVLAAGLCRKELRPWNIWFKLYMFLAACVSPPVALLFWKAARVGMRDWKGSYDYKWYYCLDSDEAFVVMFPLFIVNSLVIAVAIFWTSFRTTRYAPMFASTLNGLTCLWSTLYTVYIGGSIFGGFDDSPAWGPGVMVIGFSLLTVRFRRELTAPGKPLVWVYFLWGASYVGSLTLKIPLAVKFYESLPDQQPPACFIVTASAQGHPGIVRSEYDPNQGYYVNGQLRAYRQFEYYLMGRWPYFHQKLRRAYNVVGPIIARQIRCRGMADMMYFALKPGEWVIRLFT